MKLANPLEFPLSVLAGSLVLFVGVRLAHFPNQVMLPLAVTVSIVGSSLQKSREPKVLSLNNPGLNLELQSARQQAQELAFKAENLRSEAKLILIGADQLDLLAGIEFACDRVAELPSKIDTLAYNIQGPDSLFAIGELQKKLNDVNKKLELSSGIAKEQLDRLAKSLKRNIQLAQQGKDARQAQVVNLSTIIFDSVGLLQSMQNQLRNLDLKDASRYQQLQLLSNELVQFQENLDLLITQ